MSEISKAAQPLNLSAYDLRTFDLHTLTSARVGLTRTGCSIATREALEFTLAHAQARDAVHATLSLPSLLCDLRERGLDAVTVKSAAGDRGTYLGRPDLGRKLSEASAAQLALHTASCATGNNLTIILADGLSALAVDRHATRLLDVLLPLLQPHFTLTPFVLAEQARVAMGDEIGRILQASLTIMLIGERPGLSSADSLGAYITWSPQPGRTDAERNCISNIRTQGLDYATAAARIAYLCREAQRLQVSGIAIKEEAVAPELPERGQLETSG